MLLIGIPGAGKTHLLGTVGRGNKALVLDTEGGNATYTSLSFRADPNAGEVDIVSFEDFNDLEANGNAARARQLIDRVESVFDYLISTKNADGYKVVALDSLTEFQERFLALHNANDPRQSYGAFKDALRTLVYKARLVPAHTVFTARAKANEDETLGRVVIQSAMAPSARAIIEGLMDNLSYLNLKPRGVKQVRVLDSNHSLAAPGKDRMSLGQLENPSFVSIMERLQQVKEQGDNAQAEGVVVPPKESGPRFTRKAAGSN